MSLREELERVLEMGNNMPTLQSVNDFLSAATVLIRDHGQALLDALDAEAKWKEMTDQARLIQNRHLDHHDGDVYHAMQSLASKFGHRWKAPLTEAIDAAIKGDG